MKFSMFEPVAAAVDLPELGVRAGAVGAIVEIYGDGTYEVEFELGRDDELVFGPASADQLMPAPAKQVA